MNEISATTAQSQNVTPVPVLLKPTEWRLIFTELRHLGIRMELGLYLHLAKEIEKQISEER